MSVLKCSAVIADKLPGKVQFKMRAIRSASRGLYLGVTELSRPASHRTRGLKILRLDLVHERLVLQQPSSEKGLWLHVGPRLGQIYERENKEAHSEISCVLGRWCNPIEAWRLQKLRRGAVAAHCCARSTTTWWWFYYANGDMCGSGDRVSSCATAWSRACRLRPEARTVRRSHLIGGGCRTRSGNGSLESLAVVRARCRRARCRRVALRKKQPLAAFINVHREGPPSCCGPLML